MIRAVVLSSMFVLAVAACGRDNGQYDCEDLLPPEQTSFGLVADIVTNRDDPRNCAVCHNSDHPYFGMNMGTPAAAYYSLRDRFDYAYAQVASGHMPKNGETWSEDDLRALRSWYCRGALYD